MQTAENELVLVKVPLTATGIAIGQLAKRLGLAVDALWIPMRPNSRQLQIDDGMGVAIVSKEAMRSATDAASDYDMFRVPNIVPSGSAPPAPAMISNRVKMVRAMRGIGDGRGLQLMFRLIPADYVCYMQAAPNSRVVVGKLGKDEGVGDYDVCYNSVLVRAGVTKAALIAEGCVLEEEAKKDAQPAAVQLLNVNAYDETAVGTKRVRNTNDSGSKEKKKPSALERLLQTPEGAFLSDTTHSDAWRRIRSELASSGLHKPPLHRSGTFYPTGTSALVSTPTSAGRNPSSGAPTSTKRVSINGYSWTMMEPHCLTTSFNFRTAADLVNLSTSNVAAIVADDALLSHHRFFRRSAEKVGAAEATSNMDDAEDRAAQQLALAFETSVQQSTNTWRDVSVTRGCDEAAFGAMRQRFQARLRELALGGYRIVLFAFAPELHHADKASIEGKLSNLALCVGDLVNGADMPPVTLLVSVASAVTSSASWAGPALAGGSAAADSNSAVNARMVWRAFVRHINQNKFPNEKTSFVVVGHRVRGAAALADVDANEGVFDMSGGDASTVLSDRGSSQLPATTHLASYLNQQFARQCVGENGVLGIKPVDSFLNGR